MHHKLFITHEELPLKVGNLNFKINNDEENTISVGYHALINCGMFG